VGWLRRARVIALRDQPEHNCFIARDEDLPGQTIRVRYGIPERNENFSPTLQIIRKVFGFPVALNLLDVDLSTDGEYRPRAIVAEPDYLVDVSAIAECFKPEGTDPYAYLVRKFLPIEANEAKLLGNVANFFLDRLLNEPTAEWADTFRATFQLYPFAYAPMTDSQVKTLSGKAQKHFLNLQSMASSGLAREGIAPENSFLEPAFFSEQYGIQGRLDLFFRSEDKAAIVELKSGTPFKPNSYGIQRSHFTQTLLYDLLVRSVYGHSTDPAKYILYSGADTQPLRFAPTVPPEQWEALQVRNQIVALERLLTKIEPGQEAVPAFSRLRATHGKGFTEREFAQFETAYTGLSSLEKKYFNAFVGFTAREHWLAKIGEEGTESSSGLANLWRSHFEDKQLAFSILSHLEILENHADQPEPRIIFKKTEHTNPLANFRIGDIAVLYPAHDETDSVLHHQVIKCTITDLATDTVAVQLRYRQHNLRPFDSDGYWCLEPDLMDTGFAAMYRGLLEWASAGAEMRRLLFAPTPGPSPDGRGDWRLNAAVAASAPIAPLPSGVGSRKVGSFGEPEETAPPDRWHYLLSLARTHRKFPTAAENLLWQVLRDKKMSGVKFRRQHPIDAYVVDFASLEYRLAVEIDGETHTLQAEYDEQRTEYLGMFGFAVIRFTNDEVERDMDSVLQKLAARLEARKKELEAEKGMPLMQVEFGVTPPPMGRGIVAPTGAMHGIASPLPIGGGVGGGVTIPQIATAPHFFLLWGPPGTGKTSVMLRDLAAWVLRETTDNLLLLAYTNRAVDEICEALESIGGDIRAQYLRVGGLHSTAERFRAQLLSTKIADAKTRAELRAVLDSRRIFVSTVASFGQNDGLLKLKKFQRLVVDEASQILEPQLIGLLTRFEHFVLIGDHRQLPAVTAQRADHTRVEDSDLLSIGLRDLRDSYFERLYRLCQARGWHQHYGQLERQGRMHADIMDFPNRFFYGGNLQTLAETPSSAYAQHAPLHYEAIPDGEPFLGEIFGKKRVVFFSVTPEISTSIQAKTSHSEAVLAARIVLFFKELWQKNGRAWSRTKTLGIITPWRAQIAQIRAALAAAGLDPDEVTVDTVERYQGGARDVVVVSTCVHSEFQLASLVSLSGEGVDRKLNVALTRAREHLILLGNETVLRHDPRYQAFIEEYKIPFEPSTSTPHPPPF
jgi:very-short-patch-repair endonuclease